MRMSFHRIAIGLILAAGGLLGCESNRATQEAGEQRAGNDKAAPTRTVAFTYSFTIRDIPAKAKKVVLWVPVAQSSPRQDVQSVNVTGGLPYEKVSETEYGNQFFRFDLTESAARGGEIRGAVEYVVTRKAYRKLPEGGELLAAVADTPAKRAELARYLLADSLVPIDGKIAEEARKVTAGAGTPLRKARRLYDHIVGTLRYDKTGQGWGRGDAIYACDVRRGNCTDFHSLFIGESRSLGVPARFIMGVPLPEGKTEGIIGGYHCWAEFYLSGKGWVPLDASEAYRHPGKKEALFAGLDENRIEFTVGRDIRLPGSKGAPLNYVIYPYIEVDGKPHAAVTHSFHFRDPIEKAGSTGASFLQR